jgi:hypothetical protein
LRELPQARLVGSEQNENRKRAGARVKFWSALPGVDTPELMEEPGERYVARVYDNCCMQVVFQFTSP